MTHDLFCCPFFLPNGKWEEVQDWGPTEPGPLSACMEKAGNLTSLCLGFFICKLEVKRSKSQSYHKGLIVYQV